MKSESIRIKIFKDHKQLVSIFKNARTGSIRIEGIKLKHQDITFKVQYQRGSENPADFWSRHAEPLSPTKFGDEDNCEVEKLVYA